MPSRPTDPLTNLRHGKTLCGARNRQGETCKLYAGWGTPHPGIGKCKLHGGSTPNHIKAAIRHETQRRMITLGMPMDVTAAEALIWLVHAASGHVAWLHEQVGAAEDLTAEQTAMLVTLYGEERDRLAQVAKSALDAGVDAGQVQLAQRWGRLMGELIKAVLDDLDLDRDQMQRAPDVVRYHLGRFNEGDEMAGMTLGEG